MKKIVLLIFSFIFIANESNAQAIWTQTTIPPGGSVWAIATIGNNLFAGTTSGGVYFSNDNGTTWIQRNGAISGMQVYSLTVNGSDLFAGTGGSFGAGIYKSSDLGISWTNITPIIMSSSSNVRALVSDGTNVFAGTYGGGGIFKSPLASISTLTWSTYNTGLTNQDVSALAINGTTIYAGTYGNGVNISSTTSAGWSTTLGMASFSDYIRALTINNTTIFAGNVSGLPVAYRSTDSGANWDTTSTFAFMDMPVYALFHVGNTIYAGTEGQGVVSSPDNGTTWLPFNNGFKDGLGNWYCSQINIRSLDTLGTTLFAGSDCGVWKISIPTGINDLSETAFFSIFPNPNNGLFSLAINNLQSQKVSIKITNVLGQTVYTNQFSDSKIELNLSENPKGIYLVQLSTTDKTSTKKIIIE